MDELHVEAAGVVIKDGGYKRSPLDIARDFMLAYHEGRFGIQSVEGEAADLAQVLTAYARTYDGPIIPAFTFGGDDCLCKDGTETWCRAVRCPRQSASTPSRAEGA